MSKIFLSYAHEDIGMAKKIYSDLIRYDLDIWLDIEFLLPGQNWRVEIEKVIENSTYFLVLLSSNSMTNNGFIPKEIDITLEILELYPKSGVSILPVRLDECEPLHKSLEKIKCVDIFPENEYKNGIKKILQVVNPETFTLRNQPSELSDIDVINMIRKYSFYEYNLNPEGFGLSHQYKEQAIEGFKVIFDEVTGLMWQQSGSMEWMIYENAKKWIQELNRKGYAAYNDWRLPTMEEAMSIMEREKMDDLFIDTMFDKKLKWIWTSDLVKGESRAWVVYFFSGNCYSFKFNSFSYVRAVRSG